MTSPAGQQDATDALRDTIAAIDRDIIVLIRRRLDVACALGRAKRLAARPIADPTREAEVLRHATLQARREQLDPERVRDVFWSLIAMCRAAQVDAAMRGDDG